MGRNMLAIMLVLGAGLGSRAVACSTHGSAAAGIGWLPVGSSGGVVSGLVTLESTLVAPTSSTTCVAGIGLGSTADPLPVGVDVVALEIIVLDTSDGSRTPFAAFSFAPNSVTSAALVAGSGSSGVPGTNPLFAGSTWFGFSSAVDPFVPPVLGPGEITAFEFTVEVAEALLPLVLDAQFAGGEGYADGTPIFTGDHPAQYFTAARPVVTLRPVPEPSAWMMTWVAAAMFLARRAPTTQRAVPARRG